MKSRTVTVTLAYTRDPRVVFETEVIGVDDARDAYRIAFSRLLEQLVSSKLPGRFADWRLDKVEFTGAGRMTALVPVPPRR